MFLDATENSLFSITRCITIKCWAEGNVHLINELTFLGLRAPEVNCA